MKPRIGIYGRMNAGKSSLLNFLTAQQVSIVSTLAGTTTDPVKRSYELLGVGAVVFIDTAGFDDMNSELSERRVAATMATIDQIDLALFVCMGDSLDDGERAFLDALTVPYIVVHKPFTDTLQNQIAAQLQQCDFEEKPFFGSDLARGERVLLVCPIDSQAPAGRLILPQVQAIRAALDLGAMAIVVQPEQLRQAITDFAPNLVVTDSSAFDVVTPLIPRGVKLTSFSILLSQTKGDMELYRSGLSKIDDLHSSDRILIVEYCSHGTNCEDIARVKIPRLLQHHAGCELNFTVCTTTLPPSGDLSSYAMAVQCGGCMASAKVVRSNIERCRRANLPITSFGLLLQSVAPTFVTGDK